MKSKLLKKLYLPPKKSHKGDNGVITIIAGSKQYHGSALLAIKAASYFVDLIYFYSYPENQRLLRKLKAGASEFINIPQPSSGDSGSLLRGKESESPDELRQLPTRAEVNTLTSSIEKSDAILIGPGLEVNKKNKILINNIIKQNKNKKFVLDAGALRMIDKKLLGENIILTPHKEEYKALFGKKDPFLMAKKYKCTIVLKGQVDLVCNSKKKYYNKGGNAGMTKGGTGDVLAGLITALAAKNDALPAAFCGAFFNKKAAEDLKRKVGYFFNASDLAKQLPKTAYNFLKFRILRGFD